MKRLYSSIYLIFLVQTLVCAQQLVKGRVIDRQSNTPLQGSTVRVNGTERQVMVNEDGVFQIETPINATLRISHLNFMDQEVFVQALQKDTLVNIGLYPLPTQLREVEIVSTGYQQIPKERATGSFAQVDRKLFNRRVSANILDRLEDVVPGLVFNREPGADENSISIRGQSTINANDQPLIVVDNFPYEGNVAHINPNDVASVSVLKDAAAASVWGARAGNGVIVITTKRGRLNQPIQITFNANATLGEKPNLYYLPIMSTADYIETERRLFNEGYFLAKEKAVTKTPLTPVVEQLIAVRDGKQTVTAANLLLEQWKTYDVRKQINSLLLRPQLNQQYALSMKGGSALHRYYLSGGYDAEQAKLKGNRQDRFTLTANNTLNLFNHKLELTANVYMANTKNSNNNPGTSGLGLQGASLYPYAQLQDAQGNSLPIAKDYRSAYTDSIAALGLGLLDWQYKPLDELLLADNCSNASEYLINTGVSYVVSSGLRASLLYQYSRTSVQTENLHDASSYFSRNLINRFTQVNDDGSLHRPIPLGGMLDNNYSTSVRQSLRGQLTYEKLLAGKHRLNGIAGYEIRDLHTVTSAYRLYGYDTEHATAKTVDYVNPYASFIYPESVSNLIPNEDRRQDLSDRFLSYYSNLAYSFRDRYTFSASARLDKSNLFGVNTNQKGVPLWSVGAAWTVTDEPFFRLDALPYLKIRATYGYSGNIDKSLSAYTTALYYNGNDILTRQPYASILNPPNPELRWEKISTLNLGADINLFNRIRGSIEYYVKRGRDLIGETAFPHYTGITSFRGNVSNIDVHGMDLQLNVKNIDQGLKWTSDYLFSYAGDKVTDYQVKATVSNYMTFLSTPLEGKPLYALYSYRWAGLDAENGDPKGYLGDGSLSTNYAKIIAQTEVEDMLYNGRARPLIFGALRNTFSWHALSLSFNISYRFGYYFRRYSIQYGDNYGLGGHGDYYQRWQQTGDELLTNVPAIPIKPNSNRDRFYRYASVLVEKGDHIRLQDITLGYEFNRKNFKTLPVANIQVYSYINNLGLLWKATKHPIDPDYQSGPMPKTIALGVKVDF